MRKLNCENVRIAAMAMADGYRPEVSSDRVEAHLANCPSCRRELDQLHAVATLLDGQERQRRIEQHMWTRIEGRLPDASAAQKASTRWYPFKLLALLLLSYKLVEMIPERNFGLLFKLVPILFIITAFGYLKVNPFKINTELRLDGEE